jgi:predicted DNA-binding transcriptional regulator AlpA
MTVGRGALLTIENAGDDLVGIVDRETAHQCHRVFVGAHRCDAAMQHVEIDLVKSATAPPQCEMWTTFTLVDGNDDLFEKGAQQFLLFAWRRRRRLPYVAQIGAESEQATSFVSAERCGTLLFAARQLCFGGLRSSLHRPVSDLRRHWNIARYEPPTTPPERELLNIKQTAEILGVATSTIHRWLNDGIIAGEQFTPGAPWRIRITDDLRARVAEEAPEGYLTMYQVMRRLGVSRQTVWQRVKRGEIEAVHVRNGRKKGLRLRLNCSQPNRFNQTS